MCGENEDMVNINSVSRLRDPYIDSELSQLFDYMGHAKDGTCQRCGSKKGPFYTIDLNDKKEEQDYELLTTMSMPEYNKIFLCKKCHTDLRNWVTLSGINA